MSSNVVSLFLIDNLNELGALNIFKSSPHLNIEGYSWNLEKHGGNPGYLNLRQQYRKFQPKLKICVRTQFPLMIISYKETYKKKHQYGWSISSYFSINILWIFRGRRCSAFLTFNHWNQSEEICAPKKDFLFYGGSASTPTIVFVGIDKIAFKHIEKCNSKCHPISFPQRKTYAELQHWLCVGR